jgi:GNAT superfamily N-acetyltransferase
MLAATPCARLVSGMPDQQIAERIRQGWRAELAAPDAFRVPGRHVQLRSEHDPGRAGWIGVVALGDSTCVSLPPTASAWLQVLQHRFLDDDLTDPATVTRVIGPVEAFLGPATLAFLDPTAVEIDADPRVTSVPAAHESVQHLAAACGPQDAQESGILAVDSSVAVWLVADRVVAASGHQVWQGQLGHLSVLVDPTFRGRGLGKAVAARAVGQVLDAGLVPQWRARSTLLASRQIARSLGFVELGRQATYKLASPR